jgi:orotidine-5'-phosphate decarboxylase
MHQPLIRLDKSIIPSLDVPTLGDANNVVHATAEVTGISAYKVGFELGFAGLPATVSEINRVAGDNKKPIIFDMQKAGNDIPDTGAAFARSVKRAGCAAAILFPFTGPLTQREWTKACQGEGLVVIMGGIMTHPQFLVSEGGYIPDDVPMKIYDLAIETGVTHFVVPGNRLGWVKKLTQHFRSALGEDNYDVMGPGFVLQGGDVAETGVVAGKRFHGIVGRGITDFPTIAGMHKAALALTKKIAA